MRDLHTAARTTVLLMLRSITRQLTEVEDFVVWAGGQRRAALTNSVPERCDQLLCEGLNSGVAGAGVEAVC